LRYVVVAGGSVRPVGGERRLCGSGAGAGAGVPVGGESRLFVVGEPVGGERRLFAAGAPVGGDRRLDSTHERNRAKKLTSCESRDAAKAALPDERTTSSDTATKTRIPFRINPPHGRRKPGEWEGAPSLAR
jgi:hypothetical protein